MTASKKHFTAFALLAALIAVIFVLTPFSDTERSPIETAPRKPARQNKAAKPDTGYREFFFPKGFVWGAAVSAFQTEGGNGLTDWDAWRRYYDGHPVHPGFTDDDFAFAETLGIKELRFSIEWARIEPREGEWDRKELARVASLVRRMQARGIRPFVNLHHFTLPHWVSEKGGLENDSFPSWFARYAGKVAVRLKPYHIVRWMTFNEPVVPIETGYLNGDWPPEKKRDVAGATRALWNIVGAHKRAYRALHRTLDAPSGRVKVGMAYLDHLFVPKDPKSREDANVAALMSFGNEVIIRAVEDYLDYIGLNYYTRSVVSFSTATVMFGRLPVAVGYTNYEAEGGMEIYPPGIGMLVRKYLPFRKPILITENGIDDEKGGRRAAFIRDHLRELHKVMAEARRAGAPVEGYFYWTLTDSFEWGTQRLSHFGLVAYDPKSGSRAIRPSSFFVRDVIRARGVSEKMLIEYNLQ